MEEIKELLDLEISLEELKSLDLAEYLVLPINAELDKFESKIKKFKYPLWIKLNSSEHKLKLDAVRKSLDFEELKKTYSELKKKFPNKKFIIMEDIKGTELIVGIKEDLTFGKVLLIGTGGSLTELIKDTSFRILPVEKEEIHKMIKELKIFKILEEKKVNIKNLIDQIKKFSDLPIREGDLNPIIVNEKEIKIVDARINIEEQ